MPTLTNADLLALFPDDPGFAVGNEPDISMSGTANLGPDYRADKDPKLTKEAGFTGEIAYIADGFFQHVSGGYFDGSKIAAGTLDGFDIIGSHLDDVIFGGAAGGNIYSLTGTGAFERGSGNDLIVGGGLTHLIEASGRIKLTVSGEIVAQHANNYFIGSSGNDTIKGGGGNEIIQGGGGVDLLYAGGDNDRFVFNPGDLVANHYDGIIGFEHGDKIDLRGFGPDLTVSTAAFDPKVLLINPDAHGHSDLGIRVYGDHVTAADLLTAAGVTLKLA